MVATPERAAARVPVDPARARPADLSGPTVPAPSAVAVLRDRALLGSLDGHLDLLDLSGPAPRPLSSARLDEAGPVGTLEFGSGATRVAVGGAEGPGSLRRVPDLAPGGRLDVAEFGFAAVARFRPDGRQVAVGGNDGNVAFYDVVGDDVRPAGRILGAGPAEDRRRISDLAWSPDGATLAVDDEGGVHLVPAGGSAQPAAPVPIPGLGPTSAITWPQGRPLLLTWSSGELGAWDVGDDGVVRSLGSWQIGSRDTVVARTDATGRWLAAATPDTWTSWGLGVLLEVSDDPVPNACLAAAGVATAPDRAAQLAEADVAPLC